MVERASRQHGVARENPQVLIRAASDHCPAVIPVQLHHVVVGIEEPEERNPQLTLYRGELGAAVCDAASFGAIVDAAIDDFDPSVGRHAVGRFHLHQPPLEGVVVTRDFIPIAHITIDVQRFDGMAVDAVRPHSIYGAHDQQGNHN